jgi:phosphoglycerate dehydrogenase-like enzyme
VSSVKSGDAQSGNRIYVRLASEELRLEIKGLEDFLPPDWTIADGDPAGAAAILTIDADVTAEDIDRVGPSLRVIAQVESSVSTIAPTVVPIVRLPRVSTMAVAEHTVMVILALSRRLLVASRLTKAGVRVPGRDVTRRTDEHSYTFNWIGLDDLGLLFGKTAGIIGLGGIGRAVAERLRPFGVRLLYTQRHRLDRAEEGSLGVEWRPLDELLAESDVVTLHQRLQGGPGGNARQIGPRQLALMKPTAYIVNTARGGLIDESALVEALAEKQIAGAALDVFTDEPLPAHHRLLRLAGDDVILTAHIAGGGFDAYWQFLATKLMECLSPATDL